MSGPTLSNFTTNQLIGVVPNLKRSQKFCLDQFFTNTKEADSEYVSIDVYQGIRRLSPFCSPLVEGKLVEAQRFQTNMFKPAYIKDKRAPDLRRPVMRAIGERIGGILTGIEREMQNLNYEMSDQIDMLDRTMEWMAVQELLTGTVTIAGDGFPSTLIDFGRSSSLTIALSGGATWTQANFNAGTASAKANIMQWQQQILQESGAVCDKIVFSQGAWEAFMLDPDIKQQGIIYPLLNKFGASGMNNINPGADIDKGGIYMGNWGRYELWVYNDWFVDSTNTEQPMMAANTLIMSGPQLMGTRAFGQILDPTFNYGPLPYAPKTWVVEDPAQRFIMLQSSPLMIPSRVNASLGATVQ